MFKTIKNISLSILILANLKLIGRLGLIILLFFGIEIIYAKWQDPELNLGEVLRRNILYIYTILQIVLATFFIFQLKNVVWGEKAAKIVEAKKSFNNMPNDYKDILDVKKYPNLK
tara:strand:- start:134 stop:478 length:345 start_codon:yes stop_codon:yes gene_type:complete